MAPNTILIIDPCSDHAKAMAAELKSKNYSVLTADTTTRGCEMLRLVSPDLLVVSDVMLNSPLKWVEHIYEASLACQVIVIADKPNFNQAMDWVSGGVFCVLGKTLDWGRFHSVIAAALEHSETLKTIKASVNCEAPTVNIDAHQQKQLQDFYRGLAGQICINPLKKYIIDSVKKMTGAQEVELKLIKDLNDASEEIFEAEEDFYALKAPLEPRSYSQNAKHIKLELIDNGIYLGKLRLCFESSFINFDLEVLGADLATAIAAALGAVLKY
ncbi:MAG: hypothetical protein ACRCTY_06470, partial [Candidatus Adiutrix sp.]